MAEFQLFLSEEPLGRPLSAFQSRVVDASELATIASVLQAGGAEEFNSFALVTDDIRDCVEVGADRSISGAKNLVGIQKDGTFHYDRTAAITVEGFLLACGEGYFEGDPCTWVVYPWGTAGGWMPDGLHEVADWLLEQGGDAAIGAAVALGVNSGIGKISRIRYRKVRKDWRTRGLTAPRVRDFLLKQSQWDENHLARRLGLEPSEARGVLHQAGYVKSPDGLWRTGDDAASRSRQAKLESIAKQAENDTP